jgi:hypothetical protein
MSLKILKIERNPKMLDLIFSPKNEKFRDTDRVLAYRIGQELLDPDSGEVLGKIEIPICKAKIIAVTEKLVTARVYVDPILNTNAILQRSSFSIFRNSEYSTLDINESKISDYLEEIYTLLRDKDNLYLKKI